MRFEISKSLYPDGKIRFIARDSNGTVRLREQTLKELEERVKEYNKIPHDELIEIEGNQEGEPNNLTQTEGELSEEQGDKKEFLNNDLKEKIETKRKRSGKKTFWDKLK